MAYQSQGSQVQLVDICLLNMIVSTEEALH